MFYRLYPGAPARHRALCPVPGVHRNLLIRFANDTIDETPDLATMLQANSSISAQLDLTVTTSPFPPAPCLRLHSVRRALCLNLTIVAEPAGHVMVPSHNRH